MRCEQTGNATGSARAGLTVVEVLVALVIVSVGLLGIAGTSTLALRTTTAAARERAALSLAELRLATLAASGCPAPTTGASGTLDAGVRERWSVSAPVRGMALVDATADWRERGRIRSLVLRSAIPC